MAITMKNVAFWDIRSQFIPHRKHYMSATELSLLMLCKIWDFHGGYYEECRLLGYKNPVQSLEETHYISTTELADSYRPDDGGHTLAEMSVLTTSTRHHIPFFKASLHLKGNVQYNQTPPLVEDEALKNALRSVLQLPFTANAVPSSPMLVTLMMETIRSCESFLTRHPRRLHSS
jgi:hypothetical protein